MSETKVTKELIPFPFAVAITVTLLLITGLFFGKWAFTTWIVFITWAEYFAFGAKPSVGKHMLPGLAFGCFTAMVWMGNWVLFESLFGTNYSSTLATWLILSVTNFVWIAGLVYAIGKIKHISAYGLAVFNGLTLYLAVYFTWLGGAQNVFPLVGPLDNSYWVLLWTFIWTLAMEWLGYFAAVFNVWITFPREVEA